MEEKERQIVGDLDFKEDLHEKGTESNGQRVNFSRLY